MRGSASGQKAIDAFKAIKSDDWAGKNLSNTDISRLAATATQEGLSGDDALLTIVNVSADEYTWNEASEYSQLVTLATGAMEGLRTGKEAATAFVNVSANKAVYDSLDAEGRFQLAAAALSTKQGTGTDAANAYAAIHADSSLQDTNTPTHDALLAAAMVKGFDADSSSQLLDWYNASTRITI